MFISAILDKELVSYFVIAIIGIFLFLSKLEVLIM